MGGLAIAGMAGYTVAEAASAKAHRLAAVELAHAVASRHPDQGGPVPLSPPRRGRLAPVDGLANVRGSAGQRWESVSAPAVAPEAGDEVADKGVCPGRRTPKPNTSIGRTWYGPPDPGGRSRHV